MWRQAFSGCSERASPVEPGLSSGSGGHSLGSPGHVGSSSTRVELVSSALQGRFLTTLQTGKSSRILIFLCWSDSGCGKTMK